MPRVHFASPPSLLVLAVLVLGVLGPSIEPGVMAAGIEEEPRADKAKATRPPEIEKWVPTARRGIEPPTEIPKFSVRCSGNDVMTIDGKSLEGEAVMILAQGDCKLTITGSDIVSTTGVALVARGRAQVTIRESKLEGSEGAVALYGRATIDARGSEFWGGFLVQGSKFEFVEDGSNGFWPRPLRDLLSRG